MRILFIILVSLSLSSKIVSLKLSLEPVNSVIKSDDEYENFDVRARKTTTSSPSRPGAWPANSTVCYDYVGCFSNNAPFNNTGLYLPINPLLINTSFLFFNPKSPNSGQFLSYKDLNSIKILNFDKTLSLKIVIHGFSNELNTPWLHILKNSLLAVNANVLIVGWGNGAIFPLYNNATSNIRVVGKELSLIVNNITGFFYPNDVNNLKIHCIGHSLGAHICGHAGDFSKKNNIFFDRITGLDPAGPFFEGTNIVVRLDPSDAKFVDIYHTNAGTLISGSFGYIASIGHVDFYVNGGSNQPGCSTSLIGSIFDPNQSVGCSHNRVVELYTESINSKCSFIAFKCESMSFFENGACNSCENFGCSVFGYRADQYKVTGSMYLATMESAPYCAKQYLFSINIAEESSKTAGEIITSLNDESVSITNINDDINPGKQIKKLITLRRDASVGEIASIQFNKKPKVWYQLSDPNALNFIYQTIKFDILPANATWRSCDGKTTIEDKQKIQHKLSLTNC